MRTKCGSTAEREALHRRLGEPREYEQRNKNVVLRPGGKGEKKYRNGEALVLGLKSLMVRLLDLAVPAPSQEAPVGRELAYFPCQLEREALIWY